MDKETIFNNLVLKKYFKEKFNDTRVQRKILFKWVELINLMVIKKEVISRSYHIYALFKEKYLRQKYFNFKKYLLRTTSKIVFKMSRINTARIDHTIIENQSIVTPILEKEEKSIDSKISYFKLMLFGINSPVDNDQSGKGHPTEINIQNFSSTKFSVVNQVKMFFLSKYIIIRNYNILNDTFRKWKNADWKYQSFVDIIDKFNYLRLQKNNLRSQYLNKKKSLKKALIDYDLYYKNLCEQCFGENITFAENIYSELNNLNEVEEDDEDNYTTVDVVTEEKFLKTNSNNNNDDFFQNKKSSNIEILMDNYIPKSQSKNNTGNINFISKLPQRKDSEDSNFSETKKIDYTGPNLQNLNFNKETINLQNNTTIKERIILMENRIKSLNNNYQNAKVKNEELLIQKYKLIEMIECLKEKN